jgi:hypothetical protein
MVEVQSERGAARRPSQMAAMPARELPAALARAAAGLPELRS